MKKSLIAFLLVFALAITALAVGGGALLDWQRENNITEETLLGDASAAEGLQINVKANFAEQLFWETEFSAATDPSAESDFTFYTSRQGEERIWIGNTNIALDSVHFGISGTNLDLSGHDEQLMMKPVQDVESRTAAGETRQETLYLKDYYDYYPIRLDMDSFWGYYGNEIREYRYTTGLVDISDLFRIPVQDDLQVTVDVTKDSDGRVNRVNSQAVLSDSGYEFYNDSVVTREASYFVFVYRGANHPDYSEVKLGYGLYRMPLEMDDRASYIRVEGRYSQIENVWPINYPETVITALDKGEDDSRLYLTTLEPDGAYMTVLRTKDHTQIARLYLGGMDSPEVRMDEELLVLTGYDFQLSQHRILAFDMETWEPWLNAELPVDEDCGMSQPVIAFDGIRLAVADWLDWDGSVRVLIYRAEGLQYMGDYRTDLSRTFWGFNNRRKDNLRMTWQ